MTAALSVVNATPERVRLEVVESGAGDTRTQRITRTDANGTRAVRVPAGTFPLAAGTHTIDDHEASLRTGGTITYRAFTVAGDADDVLTSDPWTGTEQAHLTVPLVPSLGLLLADGPDDPDAVPVTRYGGTRLSSTTLHPIIGRTDPVAVLGPSALPVGALEFATPDLERAGQLVDLLARGWTYMLRQSDQPGLDLYFVVTGTALEHGEDDRADGARLWLLRVDYARVAAPPDDSATTAGWTYGELAAAAGTYAELPARWDTYLDLAVGS